MSWNKKVASLTDRAVSAPTWYARRTIIEDAAKLHVEGKKYDFRELSTQFEAGDELMVIGFGADSKMEVEGNPVVIEAREGFVYTLGANLPEGKKLMVIKMFPSSSAPVADGKYWLIPVTREMVDKSKEETLALRKLGIVSPGWYRWRQILNEQGKVVHTSAQLAVSMKTFTNADAGHAGQFGLEQGLMFKPIAGQDDGGIELV